MLRDNFELTSNWSNVVPLWWGPKQGNSTKFNFQGDELIFLRYRGHINVKEFQCWRSTIDENLPIRYFYWKCKEILASVTHKFKQSIQGFIRKLGLFRDHTFWGGVGMGRFSFAVVWSQEIKISTSLWNHHRIKP